MAAGGKCSRTLSSRNIYTTSLFQQALGKSGNQRHYTRRSESFNMIETYIQEISDFKLLRHTKALIYLINII